MQLAILHHHLNRGGVTSVIANHLAALSTVAEADRPTRVVVLHDGQREGFPDGPLGDFPVELVTEPALSYDPPGAAAAPAALAETLARRLAECGCTPGDTLLHTHNHSLGKNASLPGALAGLAGQGWRMLLQVHDFAEDNRPENYRHLQQALRLNDPARLGGELYPQGAAIHYGTLTERDAGVLRSAGFEESRLHVLPNPAADFGELPSREAARVRVLPALGLPAETKLLVYPVRGIRRKNLGEMLLLSTLAPEGAHFAVTLAPLNPMERTSFDRWRLLAEKLQLPCSFDTGGPVESGGHGCAFTDMLAAADALLTTSIAEGFGMVFLEAWLAGRPLVGRDLPDITSEFKEAGVRFNGMYDDITLAFKQREDFARLPVGEQVEIVEAAASSDRLRITERVREGNPLLSQILDSDFSALQHDIAHNAAVVRDRYSPLSLGRRLADVYRAVAGSPADAGPGQSVSPSMIYAHFADPRRQWPVRNESLDQASMTLAVATDQIARLSAPMDPEPTGETPRLPTLEGVRAVLFDVYGTLLVSRSGDITLAGESPHGDAAEAALASALGVSLSELPGEGGLGQRLFESLIATIRAEHETSDAAFPEVDIRDIWRRVVAEQTSYQLTDGQAERLAVEYECRVNPIWPMPHLAETLDSLRVAGVPLGVVSNAQFFTQLAFKPLTGRFLSGWGFDPALCFWSYQHGQAKPGEALFEMAAAVLSGRDIEPSEALYVGNDLRNDVWPAQRVGFRTALFAGDARSLRWRRDDPNLSDVRPDAVVTELRQVLGLLGSSET
ncbi:HAD family hydrolase [Botrimarina sp.]|uniref:HAD family hydrolase n=1 Tax=Botrimarina sp. TaxID=2795802 RepID=UPI0032EEC6CD